MPERAARFLPLSSALLSYLVGAAVLYVLVMPTDDALLMLSYFINTLFALIVSLRWKISIHSIGVSGPAVALAFIVGYLCVIPVLLMPLVMWGRVRLKEHTPAQVTAGAASGLLLTTLVFTIL